VLCEIAPLQYSVILHHDFPLKVSGLSYLPVLILCLSIMDTKFIQTFQLIT